MRDFSDEFGPRHEYLDALEGMSKDTPLQFQERLRAIGQLGSQLTVPTKSQNLRDAYNISWAVLANSIEENEDLYTEREQDIILQALQGSERLNPTDQEISEIVLKHVDPHVEERKEVEERVKRIDVADTAELEEGGGPTFENQEFTGLVTII